MNSPVDPTRDELVRLTAGALWIASQAIREAHQAGGVVGGELLRWHKQAEADLDRIKHGLLFVTEQPEDWDRNPS